MKRPPRRIPLFAIVACSSLILTQVALGQAASTWIDGMYKAAAEKEKTQREVKMAEA